MKAYLFRFATFFLFLFLGLYGGLFSLLGVFPLALDSASLLWHIVICALAVAALDAISRPALRRGLTAALTLGLLLLVYHWSQPLWDGLRLAFHQISYQFHLWEPSILYYELPPHFSQREALPGLQALAAFLVPFLALWLGLWFDRLHAFLPGVLTVALFPGIGLVVLQEPPLLPLLALVLLIALLLLHHRTMVLYPALGYRRVLASCPVLLLVLLLLCSLFPKSTYQQPLFAAQWRQALVDQVKDLGLLPSVRPGPSISSQVDARQSFADAGPLDFDGHTVLTIQGASRGVILLRGFSTGEYTADGWEPLAPAAYERLGRLSPTAYPLNFPALAFGVDKTPTSLFITSLEPTGYLYTPYQLAATPESLSAGQFRQDAYVARSPSVFRWQLTYYPQLLESPLSVSRLTGEAAGAESDYRRWVYESYLTLPADPALKALLTPFDASSYTKSMQDRLRLAEAVTSWLAMAARYDQATPLTPEGQDLVGYFLSESHRGYCLHFASAATLMLRAYGVPARFVSGYLAQVPYDGANVDVPDKNAHAWVEIYLDGYGWHPVDVTPGFSGTLLEETPEPAPSDVAPSPSPSPKPTPAVSATPKPTPAPSSKGDAPAALSPFFGGVLPILLRVLVLVFLFLFLLILQRRLRLARWRRRVAQPDANQAVLAGYRYLLALHRRANVALPSQATALAEKAAFSQHTLSAAERARMEFLLATARKSALTHGPLQRFLLRYFWALL